MSKKWSSAKSEIKKELALSQNNLPTLIQEAVKTACSDLVAGMASQMRENNQALLMGFEQSNRSLIQGLSNVDLSRRSSMSSTGTMRTETHSEPSILAPPRRKYRRYRNLTYSRSTRGYGSQGPLRALASRPPTGR